MHWNRALLTCRETMLEWAKTMTWKGRHPTVDLTETVYEKGISLNKMEMKLIEACLQRSPSLPKCDIFIRPLPVN